MVKTKKQKALLLISGGIDSPVAGWMMKQRGLEIIALHFSVEPFSDNTPELKSKKAAKQLGIKKFITITNGKQQAILTKQCDHRFYYILQRRLFLRIAEKIAKQEDCDYLITGDNIGQVGSQTLKNMEVISSAVKIPILRPILTNDKNYTVEVAKDIKTFEDSTGPEICSVLGPSNPATKSTVGRIEWEESKIDVNKLISESLETIRIDKV
jgi:tRNA uracil 4-sulfurtransferase